MTVYTREAHPHILNSISQHTSMSDRTKVSGLCEVLCCLSVKHVQSQQISYNSNRSGALHLCLWQILLMKILKNILMFCELDNREMSYQRTLLATNFLTSNSRQTTIHNLLCYINNIYRNILLCIMQYTCKHHLTY